MEYDVVVAGLGGMGSAVLAHCAERGAKVIGLEQFARGHDLGSSSGRSRLIRKAYFEDPAYVPLLLRAYELWRELEAKSGEEILRITGLLLVGKDDGEVISGSRRAAEEHGLAIEFLRRAQIKKRYPTLQVRDDEVAVYEPDGGVLNPEDAREAYLRIAEKNGAEMRFQLALKKWRALENGFEILLGDGSSLTSRKLVLALGPWFTELLHSLGVSLRIQRNVQAWFSPRSVAYNAPNFPAFLIERDDLPAPLYGFPDFGDGVKAAFHGFGSITDPEDVEREIDRGRDIDPLAKCLEGWMPGSVGELREAKACMYSLTPDQHFVIDRHPDHSDLILCGGFSGHGFKFASVIGELVSDLALDGKSRHDVSFLSLGRFAQG